MSREKRRVAAALRKLNAAEVYLWLNGQQRNYAECRDLDGALARLRWARKELRRERQRLEMER